MGGSSGPPSSELFPGSGSTGRVVEAGTSQSVILGARGIRYLAGVTPCRQSLCRCVISRAAGQPSQDARSRTRAFSASRRALGSASLSFVQRLQRLPVADHPLCLGGLLPQFANAVLERADEQVRGLRIMDRAERPGGLFARIGMRSVCSTLISPSTSLCRLSIVTMRSPRLSKRPVPCIVTSFKKGRVFFWSD